MVGFGEFGSITAPEVYFQYDSDGLAVGTGETTRMEHGESFFSSDIEIESSIDTDQNNIEN